MIKQEFIGASGILLPGAITIPKGEEIAISQDWLIFPEAIVGEGKVWTIDGLLEPCIKLDNEVWVDSNVENPFSEPIIYKGKNTYGWLVGEVPEDVTNELDYIDWINIKNIVVSKTIPTEELLTPKLPYEYYYKIGLGIVSEICTYSVLEFTTPELNNRFYVSDSKQVTFSKGNLQYHPANDEWRFAPSQLDYIGEANSNISDTYNGWLDLFGWSTSATNFGVSTSDIYDDYLGSFVDWGTNKIDSDAPNTWRTLTYDEWEYLLNNRPNASSLKGVAQVNGVNGLIFLPDNWTCPAGVSFKSGFHSEFGVEAYGQYQTFTADQWSKLESAGAVFLPAAGHRVDDGVYYVLNNGCYWSATESGSYSAYDLYFRSGVADWNGDNRYYGLSVRLVKDLN